MSLEEVSAATRISTRFLEAIENEHWDKLPGGVFNRGFIRSVARFLGLDEDSMVAEYALETKGRVDAGVVPDPPMEMPRDWKPAIVAAIALIVILGIAAFVYVRFGNRILARLHKAPAVSAVSEGTPAPDLSAQAAPSNAAPTADPLELKVQTNKLVILTIVVDGKTALNQMVEPSEEKHFEAHDTLEITSSDSSGVVLELNWDSLYLHSDSPANREASSSRETI